MDAAMMEWRPSWLLVVHRCTLTVSLFDALLLLLGPRYGPSPCRHWICFAGGWVVSTCALHTIFPPCIYNSLSPWVRGVGGRSKSTEYTWHPSFSCQRTYISCGRHRSIDDGHAPFATFGLVACRACLARHYALALGGGQYTSTSTQSECWSQLAFCFDWNM